MIRFLCPGCEKKLAVPDDKGGKTGSCPTCKTRFQIPEAAPADDDVETGVTDDPPLKRRPPRAQDDEAPVKRRRTAPSDLVDEPPRKRRSEVSDDDDDDIPEAESARPKKRKKKRRRSESSGGGLPLGLDYFWLAIIGLALIGLPLVGLSLIFPPASLAALALGSLASMAGGVWFLVVAFKDDSTQGMLCLLIPAYSLVYLISNWEETWQPFLLQIAGTMIAVLGICAGGAGAG